MVDAAAGSAVKAVVLALPLAADVVLAYAPLAECTRQKYVPLGRPLTVSCVMPSLVEFCNATVEKEDEVLTCQLYPRMPLGSVTADQEIVKGDSVLAPAAGARSAGVGGAAAAAGMTAAISRARMNSQLRDGRFFISYLRFQGDGRSFGPDGMIQPISLVIGNSLLHASGLGICETPKHHEHG